MSIEHSEIERIFIKEGAAERIANSARMRRDQITDSAFYGDGRLRPEMIDNNLGGVWNDRHPQIGPAHVWFDRINHCLRAKNGPPLSESDGVVVATL